MNLYLLTFKQGKKPIMAWHEAVNAGEAIDLVEGQGVDVIKTVKIKDGMLANQIRREFPDLVYWLKLMEKNDKRKVTLHVPPMPDGLVKIYGIHTQL